MPKKPIAEVAYPEIPFDLAKGENLLKDAIRQFFGSIVQARKPIPKEHQTLPENIAIKAAAGLGKTSQVISELCVGQVKYQQAVHVEYYVPTHKLSSQLVGDLKAEYQIHAQRIAREERPSINVSAVKGRQQNSEDGIPLCNKAEQVTQLTSIGHPIASRLCKDKNSKCEYYTSCGYQKQFNPQVVNTRGTTLPAVTVMTHQQLFLERHSFLPKPDFIVVDESFYQAGVEKIEIGQEVINLITSEGKPSNVIKALREFILDRKPLLKSFRDLDVCRDDLLEEAKRHSFRELNGITPEQTGQEQNKYLSSAPKYLKFDYILIALADELGTYERNDSYLLSVGRDKRNNTELTFMKRKEINVPNGVPILFIDADLNEEVIKLFRPDTKVITIPVERLATVHQFDKTLSNYSRQKDSEVSEQIHTFLDFFKHDKNTLIVTTKQLRNELTDETDEQIKSTGLYGNASINHYGNLRGLNDFSDFKTVIVLDRSQPNNQQLEQNAKALWFDKASISTLTDTNYPRQQRSLRMKDGSNQAVAVSYHPDKYVQILLEISREAEITQALDRLRLLRGNKDRQVFIATSIPVDVTVDYLWDWRLFHRLLKLLEQSEVLPLHPEHFLKIFTDDSVKTKRGAQDLIKNLNNTLPLIRILIRNYVLFEYKHVDSRKSARALIASSAAKPKETLEKSIGVEVKSIKLIE